MHIFKFYRNIFFIVSLLLLGCKEVKKDTEVKPKEEIKSTEVAIKVPNQKLTNEQQIASALLAAPQEVREDAKVYGYDSEGNFITLKEGTNDMVCIADNPNKDGFEVVSYHKDLDPYMARGRVLKAEGKSFTERRDTREKEARDGSLSMPKKSATLHILHGKSGWFDIDSTKVRNANYRYVVYIPFATQASTGLSLKPNAPGHPWLMFPGKANAHIMITPPKD
ncbi:MAG: hypothetical protein L3J20_13325 [Flavobacteriaceae bacterium]|nr:hypothetical protein [Flavobacteriaceae bacterium]